MSPYLRLQLVVVALSGALSLVAWWIAGRSHEVAVRPSVRALVAGLACALLSLPSYPLHSIFALIALLFWSGALWLPLIVLGAEARRVAEGEGWDKLLSIACVAAIATGGYALFVEPNRLQIAEHQLTFEAWPESAPPLRVVQVSDLQTVGACARERRAAELINGLAPDLIVVCGDYAADPFDDPEPAIDAARAFLSSLHARLGVVCIDGHSEEPWVRERIFDGLDDLHYLQNEEIVFDLAHGQRLRVVGLTTERPALVEAWSEPGLVTLVATHVPDVSDRLEGRGVDLHLAGHTHGGQIVIPGFGPPMTLSRLPKTFARGLHRFGDHWLNVTPGIGMVGHPAPRIRLFCPPQIDYLELGGAADLSSESN